MPDMICYHYKQSDLPNNMYLTRYRTEWMEIILRL